jgi:hypothetical protein
VVVAAAVDMTTFGVGMGNRNTTDGHDGRLWRFCRWGSNGDAKAAGASALTSYQDRRLSDG